MTSNNYFGFDKLNTNKLPSVFCAFFLVWSCPATSLLAGQTPPVSEESSEEEKVNSLSKSSDTSTTAESETSTAESGDSVESKKKEKGLTKLFKRVRKKMHSSAPERLECTQVAPRPRAPVIVLGSLFTWIMPVTVRVGGYLRVQEGERITVMETENLPTNMVVARVENREGRLLTNLLQLDQHAANPYLEIADFLIEHPLMLENLLLEDNAQLPQLREQLIQLIIARRQLPQAMRTIFGRQLAQAQERGTLTELFRGQTPATAIITTLLARPGALQQFRTDFLNFAINAIKKHYRSENPQTLAVVIQECIAYLKALKAEQIPDELILLLSAVKELTNADSSLLGAIFFLRYLCPAIVQPEAFCNISIKNESMRKALMQLARALQFMANHVDPSEGDNLYDLNHQMRALGVMAQDVLAAMACNSASRLEAAESLVLVAANIYAHVMCVGRSMFANNIAIHNALDELEQRLGHAPECPIEDINDLALINEIRRIEDRL